MLGRALLRWLASDSWEARTLDPSTARYTRPIRHLAIIHSRAELKNRSKTKATIFGKQLTMFANNSTSSQLQAAVSSSSEEKSWNDWPVEMDPLSTVVLGQL